MEQYAQLKKNTVSSQNQLTSIGSVFFENQDGAGKRMLFVGNSITLHGYKPDIGWHGVNYGMAASQRELDYVHLVMSRVKEIDPDAAMCIAQVANWERLYKTGSEILSDYAPARDFAADVIIVRLIENCPAHDFDSAAFTREYGTLIDYLKGDRNPEILITTGFWSHPGTPAIIAYGEKAGYPVIPLDDLGERDDMKAIGLFEHSGVAAHPGDAGMKAIADRICDKLSFLQ